MIYRNRTVCLTALGFSVLAVLVLVTPRWLTAQDAIQNAAHDDSTTPLLTVAESSDFAKTATHAEVVSLCEHLADRFESVTLLELGRSSADRALPLLVLSQPPVRSAAEAKKTKKPVALLFGNIHAGEVCGKEGLLILARELAEKPALLENIIVAVVPMLNADGNEPFSCENRRSQIGPDGGVGARSNAQGLDLNRDWVKLEAPETRAVVRFLNDWDPLLILDTHTTNGSYHRYSLTYAGPRHPAGDAKLIEQVRDSMLPEITRRVREASGRELFFYGNFSRDRSRWETYPAWPRYGTPYRGLRGRLAILSEAYAHAPYRERVLATRDFARACLEHVAEHREELQRLVREVDQRTIDAGRNPQETDQVALVVRAESLGEVAILGWEEAERDGSPVVTNRPRTWKVEHIDRFVATQSVRRPFAYVFGAELTAVAAKLREHGVAVDVLREDLELLCEEYDVTSIERYEREFQGHRGLVVGVEPHSRDVRLDAGSFVARTAQPLGSLLVYLLEPASEDGLCRWNLFDDALSIGSAYPVRRLLEPTPLLTWKPRAADPEEPKRPITFAAAFESKDRPRLGGSPVGGMRWLPDGEHWLASRDGKRWKVHARTGKAEPAPDDRAEVTAKVETVLAALPTIEPEHARPLAGSLSARRVPDHRGTLFEHAGDLYWCRLEPAAAKRLTSTPEREELTELSPDGEFAAFIRDNDLWVVDVATATERALTTGGEDRRRHGKNDWVYFEEVFHRSWKAYWWSPDSQRIAFLEIDSSRVPSFTITDNREISHRVEVAPFPKPGEPNPRVRVGTVSRAGGNVGWVDLSDYAEDDRLVTGVGWWPDGQRAYCYVQNRTQTWLDVCRFAAAGGKVKRLFREKTEAWVEPAGPLRFLDDKSFLYATEASGWKHIEVRDSDGKLSRDLTPGEWELRRFHRVDEKAGIIWASGCEPPCLGAGLYRIRLDGTGRERVTTAGGSHRVDPSPAADLFIDRWSSLEQPSQVALFDGSGARVRTLDTNPVPALEEWDFRKPQRLTISARDGVRLEATLLEPRGFDPKKKYPVWLMTYGGPHAPTVHDAWSSSTWDQVLSTDGFFVLRCDPRSASGKGARSAWTAYRRLGVKELEDLEDVVLWLGEKPYIDATRIGMSGHSYGGFLTAFALTHSKLFAAGIAGAPVTDWRTYDTIYTERYMSTPQDNPEGYRETSVVEAAKNVHGRLLLLHGTIDDNVHLQNTLRLAHAFQEAGKEFEMMIYPGSRHGIWGKHYLRLKRSFIHRTLLGRAPPER